MLRPLKTEFKKNGVFYKLLKRERGVALFTLQYDLKASIIGWDVCMVVTEPIYDFRLHTLAQDQFCEHLPCSAEWGSKAWSYSTLKSAENKMQAILV